MDLSHPVGAYSGVWSVRDDACQPLSCLPPVPGPQGGVVGCSDEVPHGGKCKATCAPGFRPDKSDFVCDRGIYSVEPKCNRLDCEGGIPLGGKYVQPPCDSGYEPQGEAPTCAPTRTGVAFDGPLPTCEPRLCRPPPNTTHASIEDCEGKRFGDTCTVQCEVGYGVNGGTSGTVSCDQASDYPGWSGTTECQPGTCKTAAVDNADPGACTDAAGVLFTKACWADCAEGYTVAGSRDDTVGQVQYECRVVNGTFMIVPRGSVCLPKQCILPEKWLHFGGFPATVTGPPGCAASSRTPGDVVCGFTCPDTAIAVPAYQHFRCTKGVLTGCLDETCATPTDLLPKCFDKTIVVQVVPVASSVLTASVPAEAVYPLQNDKDAAKDGFALGISDAIGQTAVVTDVTVAEGSRRLQSGGQVRASFYVAVEEIAQGEDAIQGLIDTVTSGETAGLLRSINIALTDSFGEDVSVSGVTVDPPTTSTGQVQMQGTTAPPTTGPTTDAPTQSAAVEEGLDPVVIIGIVALGVGLLLGALVWFFCIRQKDVDTDSDDEASAAPLTPPKGK